MNKDKILKLTAQIELLLSALKVEAGALEQSDIADRKVHPKKGSGVNRGQGSTKPIQALVDSGFFKAPKTTPEIWGALKKKAFSFDPKDIAVTLIRFVRKEILEREGNGTKDSPWRYKEVNR